MTLQPHLHRAAPFKRAVAGLPRLVRRHGLALSLLLVVWALAYVRVFIDPTPRVPLLFNWTGSLPYKVALVRYGPHSLQRGDLVVFAFAGEAGTVYPGLAGQPFFKIVRGLPGDRITVKDRIVSINGEAVGQAKTHAFDRRPLDPIAPTVIPSGHFYVQGTGPDSFDSRYRQSGLVRIEQVLGTATPLL